MVLGSSPVPVTQTSDFAPVSSKKFLDIQATIECGFTLKRVRDMTRTYSQCLPVNFPESLNCYLCRLLAHDFLCSKELINHSPYSETNVFMEFNYFSNLFSLFHDILRAFLLFDSFSCQL